MNDKSISEVGKLIEIIDAIGGHFASGLLLGLIIGIVSMYLVTRWSTSLTVKMLQDTRKLDLEREKQLFQQLELKDERIKKLHDTMEGDFD